MVARVFHFIDPVSEAHELLFLAHLFLDIVRSLIGRSDVLQHLNHFFVRSTMEWPFKRAD